VIEYAVAAAIGYTLGAIPVSQLVARRHGVDLRRTGDGNPGAWNALEQLGPRRAWPAFVGDAAKAFAAGMAGHLLGDWWAAWAGVAGAMAGHAAPPLGGKSVMCLVGGAFALSPAAAAGCLALCGAVTARWSFAYGARAGVFAFPLAQLVTDPVSHVAGTGVLMTFIGALFLLRRDTSARASAGPGGGRTT
jgi:glycerol-3-phosphate acyltransferase PlsY